MSLTFRHLVSASQVTRQDADFLMERARVMEQDVALHRVKSPLRQYQDALRQKCIALLFYEPSTRTQLSFARGVQLLGGDMLQAQGFQFSSLYKGESIHDNTRVIAGLGVDAIVMRHPVAGSAAEAVVALERYQEETGWHVPFINAGDGNNEHPTQALLDIYTIQQECRRLAHLHVAMAGDLKNGRTVHSLTHLLSLYPGMRFSFASPEELGMPDTILQELREKQIPFEEHTTIDPALDADVLYMTRVQKERFSGPPAEAEVAYERSKDAIRIDAGMLKGRAPVLLHPLPRTSEYATDLDRLAHAAHFRQAENGLPMRMAIVDALMNGGAETPKQQVFEQEGALS